jgi:hypothetical protein
MSPYDVRVLGSATAKAAVRAMGGLVVAAVAVLGEAGDGAGGGCGGGRAVVQGAYSTPSGFQL